MKINIIIIVAFIDELQIILKTVEHVLFFIVFCVLQMLTILVIFDVLLKKLRTRIIIRIHITIN